MLTIPETAVGNANQCFSDQTNETLAKVGVVALIIILGVGLGMFVAGLPFFMHAMTAKMSDILGGYIIGGLIAVGTFLLFVGSHRYYKKRKNMQITAAEVQKDAITANSSTWRTRISTIALLALCCGLIMASLSSALQHTESFQKVKEISATTMSAFWTKCITAGSLLTVMGGGALIATQFGTRIYECIKGKQHEAQEAAQEEVKAEEAERSL